MRGALRKRHPQPSLEKRLKKVEARVEQCKRAAARVRELEAEVAAFARPRIRGDLPASWWEVLPQEEDLYPLTEEALLLAAHARGGSYGALLMEEEAQRWKKVKVDYLSLPTLRTDNYGLYYHYNLIGKVSVAIVDPKERASAQELRKLWQLDDRAFHLLYTKLRDRGCPQEEVLIHPRTVEAAEGVKEKSSSLPLALAVTTRLLQEGPLEWQLSLRQAVEETGVMLSYEQWAKLLLQGRLEEHKELPPSWWLPLLAEEVA